MIMKSVRTLSLYILFLTPALVLTAATDLLASSFRAGEFEADALEIGKLEAYSLEANVLEAGNDTTFFVGENGVTVKCLAAEIGATGIINGITYTKRAKSMITRVNAATTCTSGITDLSGLFEGAADFNQDLSTWDVSLVTDMSRLFKDASAFNADLSGWDVSNVTDMSGMFENATAFNQDISGWDVSNVTDMAYMFSDV
jgi:surface protein